MQIFDKLTKGQGKLCVVGLGYVGLPLAVEFAKKVKVIGFDINENKMTAYRKGADPPHSMDGVMQAQLFQLPVSVFRKQHSLPAAKAGRGNQAPVQG